MGNNKSYSSHQSTQYEGIENDTNTIDLPQLYWDRENCCGCTACYSICPTKAISMKQDTEGFLYPSINLEKCIRCRKCLSVCGFKIDQRYRGFCDQSTENSNNGKTENSDFYKDTMYQTPITFAVKHKSMEIRMDSRSGGIFTAISDYVLEHGGVVYGCVLTEDFMAIHVRAEEKETRNAMRGSKYIQSRLGECFHNVKLDLDNGKKVLFTGTSCQIEGLKKYLGHNNDNLWCVDIVCHGVPSPLVWQEYLKWQEQCGGGKVIKVDFRNKIDFGWKDHTESLTLDSGKRIHSKIFKTLFYKHSILRPSCYKCPYKDIIHPGDITIADYWGITDIAPNFDDNKGVNLVMINNDKGMDLFRCIQNDIDYIETRIEDSLQPPLKAPFSRPADRDQVWIDFYNLPFGKFVKKHADESMILKLKKKVWKMLHP